VVHVPPDCGITRVSTETRCDATRGFETLEQPDAATTDARTITVRMISKRWDIVTLLI
jgi:hypothetical protein